MTDYNTKAATIGDITVTVSKAKEGDAASRLEAFLKWLSGKLVDPDYGVGDRPGRPSNELPSSPGHPSNELPGQGGRPDNTLPPGQGRPDNTLPGGGQINNDLPAFIGENAKEIVAAILKGTACDPAQPK